MLRGAIGGLALAALILMAAGRPATAAITMLQAKPSTLDPAVKAFDAPNLVMVPDGAKTDAPVVLFLTGTGGEPSFTVPFQQVVAAQGYRVISLEYDDEPAVAQVCPQDPDANCSADFREMRIWGDGPSKTVKNPPAESISARLVVLLKALDQKQHGQGWAAYLKDDRPDWSRIIVSGMSQGAGMAAFIAKKYEVPRVVLFSSPWDWVGRERILAPWLAAPSATPMDRWYAEYNTRENTATEIQRAYAVLQIPTDHIRAFRRDIPDQFARAKQGPNPYHVMTIRDPGYADDWRAMFGKPGQ